MAFELTNELIYLIVGVIGVLGTVLIITKSTIFSNSLAKKQKKLADSYIQDLEDEVQYHKKKARGLQMQKNTKEQGIAVDSNGDFTDIVPEIVKGISPFIPEKLRPLFEDKEISGSIINEVLKNPDKFKGIITNMIAKTKGVTNGSETSNPQSELSV
ncbi:MAG: hypothetical protein HN879_09620 [Flavobacteriaceae bacterium]|nr:hypothetical protein [Flavobacteriaceae bacterium]